MIFFAPVLRDFQFYWRMDSGDSRLAAPVPYDVFERMRDGKIAYMVPILSLSCLSVVLPVRTLVHEPVR